MNDGAGIRADHGQVFCRNLNGLNDLNFWNPLIIGFGSLAKVLEPASLVKEIKDELAKSLRSYEL